MRIELKGQHAPSTSAVRLIQWRGHYYTSFSINQTSCACEYCDKLPFVKILFHPFRVAVLVMIAFRSCEEVSHSRVCFQCQYLVIMWISSENYRILLSDTEWVLLPVFERYIFTVSSNRGVLISWAVLFTSVYTGCTLTAHVHIYLYWCAVRWSLSQS